MSEIIKCEDVLNGIPVDWRGYEPPGGEGWRKYYTEQVKPIFERGRADAETEIASLSRRIADNRVQCFAADKIKVSASQTLFTLGTPDTPADKEICAALRDIISKCNLITEKAASKREGVEKDEKGIKVCEEDIRFFDLFREYIDADAELDKMMFAMHNVELKYRAKLLRASYKMLVLVETRREQLRHSNSVVFRETKEVLAPIFNTLDEAYAVVSVSLRMQMKDVKKNGIDALRNLDNLGRIFRDNPAAVKRISAAVTAAMKDKS